MSRYLRSPTYGVLPDSRLLLWNDITADQTIGTAPKSRMIATPGVTKAQPVNCSDARGRRRAPRDGGASKRLRRSRAAGAVTSAVRGRERLVDLLRRTGERGLRLALAQEHRHDHVAEYLGDLRVRGGLRARLVDVAQVGDERVHAGQGLVHLPQEPGRGVHRPPGGQVPGGQREVLHLGRSGEPEQELL